MALRDVKCVADPLRVNDATPTLWVLGQIVEDLQRTRVGMGNRAWAARETLGSADISAVADGVGTELLRLERQATRRVIRELRRHVLWSWLERYPGVRGSAVARLLAVIGNPHRFPGQQCTQGHSVLPVHDVGDVCPLRDTEGRSCVGTMLPPRTTTGVRSLWHYLGLHVVNGVAPKKRRGVQGDWNIRGRTLLLAPQGVADQIVRHRVSPYREMYDSHKSRLLRRGGATETMLEVERVHGSATDRIDVIGRVSGGTTERPAVVELVDGSATDGICVVEAAPGGTTKAEAAELRAESETGGGRLRIDRIARTIAVKAFVGDLLMEWKRRDGAGKTKGAA